MTSLIPAVDIFEEAERIACEEADRYDEYLKTPEAKRRAALTAEAEVVGWTDKDSLDRLTCGDVGHIYVRRSDRAGLTIPLYAALAGDA